VANVPGRTTWQTRSLPSETPISGLFQRATTRSVTIRETPQRDRSKFTSRISRGFLLFSSVKDLADLEGLLLDPLEPGGLLEQLRGDLGVGNDPTPVYGV
jgi:hypothetical protein